MRLRVKRLRCVVGQQCVDVFRSGAGSRGWTKFGTSKPARWESEGLIRGRKEPRK